GPGNVHVGHGGLDREGGVLCEAAEVRGLVQRGQVGAQSRHETINAAAEGALRAPARAGKVLGKRASGDVNLARRRSDRERFRLIVTAAAQVRRLLEGGQAAIEARDVRVERTTRGALGTPARAREVPGVRDTG